MKPFPWPLLLAAVLGGAPLPGRGQPLPIYTLAGQPDPGSTDAPGGRARFYLPLGVAADAAGNIYAADTGNSTLRKITPAGLVSTLAGLAGNPGSGDGTGTNAQFNAPQALALDPAGNLYVADTANSTIRKVTPAGSVTTLAGAAGSLNSFDGPGGDARFARPQAVAADAAGWLYVADTWNHTIRKISPAGQVTTLAGLAGHPGSADGTNSKARFNLPAGLALDAATNLYVSDFLNHTIRKITPAGAVSTLSGMPGVWGRADGTNRDARFYQPQGIAADNAGDLYIADSGNQTLRKLAASGTNWVVSTAAGRPGFAGNLDGTGSTAAFYFPAGLAFDTAGHLYLADFGNNAVRTDRVVPPALEMVVTASQLLLKWPASAITFDLETNGALVPGGSWAPVTSGVARLDNSFVYTNPTTGPGSFFRLHQH